MNDNQIYDYSYQQHDLYLISLSSIFPQFKILFLFLGLFNIIILKVIWIFISNSEFDFNTFLLF